jgi:glycine hydroxymethyltransferase
MMGNDFENPWGRTTKKGSPIMMSAILDSGVFPGMQGGPLEHVIAAKAVAFGEALDPTFIQYGQQVIKNAQTMANALTDRGYQIISGGTSNHLMLIDLRSKGVTGKAADAALGLADITVNKNMIPFDPQPPMTASGIRIGTAAITSRGFKEQHCLQVVDWMDKVLSDPNNTTIQSAVKAEVHDFMQQFPLYM